MQYVGSLIAHFNLAHRLEQTLKCQKKIGGKTTKKSKQISRHRREHNMK